MTERDEDELWRAIVDNYGERPTVTDEPTEAEVDVPAEARVDQPAGVEEPAEVVLLDEEDPALARYFPDERFTPPRVARPSRPETPRLLAWLGIFGVPVALLISVVLDIYVPQFVGLLLLAWFVGGFGYLVWSMPGPREPWDDGAQV